MPKKLEDKLRRSCRELGLKPGSDRYNACVYGTLNKIEKLRKKKREKKKGIDALRDKCLYEFLNPSEVFRMSARAAAMAFSIRKRHYHKL